MFFPWPSTISIVAFIPSSHGSNLFIALLGAGPGIYVDLERFSFHVPTIGSLMDVFLDIRSSCSRRQTFCGRSKWFRAFTSSTAISGRVQGISLLTEVVTAVGPVSLRPESFDD